MTSRRRCTTWCYHCYSELEVLRDIKEMYYVMLSLLQRSWRWYVTSRRNCATWRWTSSRSWTRPANRPVWRKVMSCRTEKSSPLATRGSARRRYSSNRRSQVRYHSCHVVLLRRSQVWYHRCHVVLLRRSQVRYHHCHVVLLRRSQVRYHRCHVLLRRSQVPYCRCPVFLCVVAGVVLRHRAAVVLLSFLL